MEADRVEVSRLQTGDVIVVDSNLWTVTDFVYEGGTSRLRLHAFDGYRERTWQELPGTLVTRIVPEAVHHVSEFVGMTLEHARAWAAALGWQFHDVSGSQATSDEMRYDRVSVWRDESGTVVRARLG